MNRPALPFFLTLCLLTNLSLAQSLLERFEQGSTALRESVAAFPDDPVGSLDALREARTAFGALGTFEAELQRGLDETFSRAERAIVNGSETDLVVQAAVLQGGFQRAVYEAALRSAAAGETSRAQTLLNALGRDLGFAKPRFTSSDQQALQGAFEARLAALALTRLEVSGSDLGSRYRALAQVYSYVFLVQDSPRLAPETRTTVLNTIRALVAEQPVDEGLARLRGQLGELARNAEGIGGGSAPAKTATETADEAIGRDEASGRAASTAPGSTGGSASNEQNTAQGGATGTAANTPVTPLPTVAEPADAVPETFPSVLGVPLAKLLMIAAGLLALLGLGQLLATAARNPAPRQGAALALLLLPAAAEGLVTLSTLLASSNLPFAAGGPLAQAGNLSLFANPAMQLVWAGLTAAAVLCLARAQPATQARRVAAPRTKPARQEASTKAALGDAITAERAPAPSRQGGTAASTLNWDDDF